MGWIADKWVSATRIARERGTTGVLRAVGRNIGLPALQAGLDESDIAWDFFRGLGVTGSMIDVGAHYGSALRPFLRQGWQVWAFEPDPGNRHHLMAEFGRHPRLKVDPRAVGESARSAVQFYRSDLSSGISGLSAFDASHRQGALIDVTTLAELMRSSGLSAVDFLKIDTEGHDLFVLRGLPWQQVRPRLILCEYENRKTEPLGYRYADLAGYLQDQGYTLINSQWLPIERYGQEHRWSKFVRGAPPVLDDAAGWGNLIALRDAGDLPALLAACQRAEQRERRRA